MPVDDDHDDTEDGDTEDGDTEDGDDRGEKYRAPALSKGLDILEHLASAPEGKTQAEIAKTLGRTTSEIFRMLMVLRKRDYVQLNDEDDRYSLTTKMFEVAHPPPSHPPPDQRRGRGDAEAGQPHQPVDAPCHPAFRPGAGDRAGGLQ